jgi:hypothetical protein
MTLIVKRSTKFTAPFWALLHYWRRLTLVGTGDVSTSGSFEHSFWPLMRRTTFPHPPRLEPCLRLSPHTAQHLWSISIAKAMKRPFPFRPHSQMHSSVLDPLSPAYPPVRVQLARSLGTWFAVYSLYFFFPKARGLRHQSSSCCARLSHAPTTMPLPTLPYGIELS